MKYAGIALIILGVLDFILSYTGTDLWGMTGIELPETLWTYSAYIEGVLGYALFRMGSQSDDEEETTEAAD